jgi:hypothetical protein
MDGVLKNFFDVILQSFGTFGSPNYDENGLRIRDICRLASRVMFTKNHRA